MAETLNYDSTPDYLKAADLHNLGAGNESIFSLDYLTSLPGRQAKFGIASIASGVNSIYNTGVAVANWFGAGAEEIDTAVQLSRLDSDLGAYYTENKSSTDLVGFVATSFVPGLGGIKLFNVGQKALKAAQGTGFIGESLATATGLLPTLEQTVVTAGKELAASQSSFTLLNYNVLKSIGQGFQQATLESLVFETAVTATMIKSPILSDLDYKDIGANIITGALLGGAIGGVLNAAGTYGKIKNEIKLGDLAQKDYTLRSSAAYLQSPSDRIVLAANDLSVTPAIDRAVAEGFEPLRRQRVESIHNDIRSGVHDLVGGRDAPLGNIVADTLVGMDPSQISNVMNGATRITRPGKNLTPREGETIGYVQLFGDDAGNVSFDPPTAITLADRLLTPEAIDRYVDSAKFGVKKNWNMVTSSGPNEIQARYMWAADAKIADGQIIWSTDIPLLERALATDVKGIVVDNGQWQYAVGRADLSNEIIQAKRDLAVELTKAQKSGWIHDLYGGARVTSDDIARAVNVSRDFLENSEAASAFARQDAQTAFNEFRKSQGLHGVVDLDYVPQNIAVGYRGNLIEGGPTLQEALVNIKYRQKLSQDQIDMAFTGITGSELAGQVVHISESQMIQANRFGAGASLLGFANGGYGTIASAMEQNGKVTANLIKKLSKDTSDTVESAALRLRENQVAAIEVANINTLAQKASGFDFYSINPTGDGLILKSVSTYRADVQAGKEGIQAPVIPNGIPVEIKFSSPEVGDAITAMIERNGARVSGRNSLAKAQGLEGNLQADVLYPRKPDPKKMPFFAFVKDETVTGAGAGHTSMIHAASESELAQLIGMVQGRTGFKVYTKADTEAFYKAQREYEFDRTLHENYIDSSLKSNGINSTFFPKTDSKVIVDEWLEHEQRADRNLAREAMATKLGNELDQLHTLGKAYTNISSSRYGVTAKSVEASSQNPYLDYAKTALDISRLSEYPTLVALNRHLENGMSRVYETVERSWKNSKFNDTDLADVNQKLQDAGINHAYKSSAEVLLANHTAPPQYLSRFIRGANSILANTFLRTDPLNALNNAVGANVLLAHETTQLIKGIKNANPALAGELSRLLEIGVPGTTDLIKSPTKLIASVMGDFVKGDSELSQFIKANGWSGRITDLNRSMLADLTVDGVETPVQLNSKLQSAFDKAKVLTEKLGVATGNQLVEEFNRFVAASVAKRISDLGVAAGVLDSASQLSYINTFINRTQGNILASQRPLIFQGPIGQAVGLFQTYQFNTIQQLFRGVSEGGPKDAAMLLGMQGTMYGLNGLPAFQFINQHIVGTASGNTAHTDAYAATYGAFGKTTGDWLMYGIPSNLIQTNLYSRGDINPRRLTVIPTSPADVVAVSAFGKFAGNIKESLGKIAGGADVWQTVLQGIEHNGLSRPLSGLAQTAQAASNPSGKVFSTTQAGDVGFINDFLSIATMSRFLGGKPLDEALANDEISRSLVYKAADKENKAAAAERFKAAVIGKRVPTDEAVGQYLRDYVHAGGRQVDFNKQLLHVMTRVDTPKANEIIRNLKGPYSQHMQMLMGGSRVAEFSDD